MAAFFGGWGVGGGLGLLFFHEEGSCLLCGCYVKEIVHNMLCVTVVYYTLKGVNICYFYFHDFRLIFTLISLLL